MGANIGDSPRPLSHVSLRNQSRRCRQVTLLLRVSRLTMAVAKQQKHAPMSASATEVGATTAAATANLWETMLRDAMRRSRLPSSTLVFVGPKGCGKSSLLDTFLEGQGYASAHNPSGSGAAAASAAVAPTPEKKGPDGGAGGSGGGGVASAVASASGGGSGGGGDPIAGQAFHPVLSYAYLDAADPAEQGAERDESPPRVSVWSCSGLEFEPLLETVLQPEELPNMAVVVAVDLSRPWEVMDSVEKVCVLAATLRDWYLLLAVWV